MDLLSQLRDIHLPPPITIWPLALGWYLLLAFFIILMLIAIYFWLSYLKKHHLKKCVMKRLEELQQEQNLHHAVSEELSVLLKRAALATFPRKEVAGLYGEEWLQFLDKTAVTNEFTEGAGRQLISSPY